MALSGWLRDDLRPSASFLDHRSKPAEGRKVNMSFVFNDCFWRPKRTVTLSLHNQSLASRSWQVAEPADQDGNEKWGSTLGWPLGDAWVTLG